MRQKGKQESAANVFRQRLEGGGGCFPGGWNALPEKKACMELPFHGRWGAEAVGTRYTPGLKILELRCASWVEGKTRSSPGQLGAWSGTYHLQTSLPLTPNQPKEQQEEGAKPSHCLCLCRIIISAHDIWKVLFWSVVALAYEGWGCDFQLFLSLPVLEIVSTSGMDLELVLDSVVFTLHFGT